MSEGPPSERRRGVRHIACFPGIVEDEDAAKRTAMISDLSEVGASLLTRGAPVGVGEVLQLELHVLFDSDEVRLAAGRVVRVAPLPDARSSFWTHQVAVEFDERLAFTPAEVDALEKRKAMLRKKR